MASKISFTFIANNRFTKITDKINRSNTKLKNGFTKLGSTVKNTGKQFSASMKNMTSGLKGLVVAALAFVGVRRVLEKGSTFQDSLADLSAITGAAGKDLDKLSKSAFNMSKTFATGGNEILSGFKLVASAKPELLENLEALRATTKQVLILKNAAGIELADAANITAQALNIFGKGADSAGKFVNILAAGAKLGSSEVTDTGEAMLIAGPAARAAGLDFGSLNAAIQAVAKGGIKGSRAGTAINAILGRMRREGTDFKKVGLEKAFKDIGDRLSSIKDPTKRAKAEAKAFGEEHSKVGLALITNFRLLGKYEKSLRGTNIAQEQANIRLSTFSAKSRKFGAVIDSVLIKVFLKLEPLLARMVDNMANFFDNMDASEIDSLAASIAVLIKGLEFLLDVGIAIAAVFKGIGTAIGELAAQIATLNFDSLIGTSFKDAFSIGGSFLGIGSSDNASKSTGNLNNANSNTNVNVNLRAPQGTIESIKSRTTGKTPGLNVGVNMAVAQ